MDTRLPEQIELNLNPNFFDQDSIKLMRNRGIMLPGETVDDVFNRALNGLMFFDYELAGTVDSAFIEDTKQLIAENVLVFGTPVLTNAGKSGEMTAACTVLRIDTNDGEADIEGFNSSSTKALRNAIGTGYDLSGLSDPAGTLLTLNEQLLAIDRELVDEHKRPVASMATLRADHPDIVRFIQAKRDVDFADWRFNISIFVTRELFDLAATGRPWHLRDSNGTVVSSIPAQELLEMIAESAHFCGEPGILFRDVIDNDNPTPEWEYESTAPCAEVSMAAGEACQFSYINVGNCVAVDSEGIYRFDLEKYDRAIGVMTRLMDAAVEQTIQNSGEFDLPLVEQKRRIGVGITGFADLLIKLRIPYDSPEAQQTARILSEVLDYRSKKTSAELSRERGAFPAFERSRYRHGDWTRRKNDRRTGIIDAEAWDTLYEEIERFGLRNASTTALPPTGTSSTIIDSSKSIEPHFSLFTGPGDLLPVANDSLLEHERVNLQSVLDTSTSGLEADERIARLLPHLQTARILSHVVHIDVQAAFQTFLDESMAKTVNLPNYATKEDVLALFWQAHKLGLKGVTVYRDRCLEDRDITHNSST